MGNRPIRKMVNQFEGWEFYSSTFDPNTGNLVRVVEVTDERYDGLICSYPSWTWEASDKLEERWREKFGWRPSAFSPVPETIDVQITNYCTVGCSYCYQNSTGKEEHANALKLIETIIKGLDAPPYQIAIGGGEPLQLPNLSDVLYLTHSLGSVPNFTTSGAFRDELVAAAMRDIGGGVALTYHRWRGVKVFERDYRWWRERVPHLHVHVIADHEVAVALQELEAIDPKMKVILLAYYGDVGRASLKGLMRKQTYNVELPALIKRLGDGGMTFAFSEGLLPWVLSRPDMGINLDFVGPQEGLFSCYVNAQGLVSHSSFAEPRREDSNVYTTRLQDTWNRGFWRNYPGGPPCYGCALENRCSATSALHVALCKYQPHNSSDQPPQKKRGHY